MINKINGVSFQSKYQRFTKPVSNGVNGVNIKRGLKAAGIYAASTIAATLGILACRGENNKKAEQNNIVQQTEVPIAQSNDTIQKLNTISVKKVLRPLNEEGGLIVKEGDSYWKIATDLLIDKGINEPTDTQIMNEVDRLLEVNFRCFDEEVYGDDVPIKPGDYIYINEVPIDYD